MGLKNLKLKEEYRSDTNDIVAEFFFPCLSHCIEYDRCVNYLSIQALATIAMAFDNFSEGNWFEPTVLTNVNHKMRIFNEEIFGPVASIMSFSDDEEVLNLANKTEYGLASYIFTTSKERINLFSENLEFGEVQVNGIKYAIYLPHGGIKESGIGHDCSHLALNDYLTKKRISIAI